MHGVDNVEEEGSVCLLSSKEVIWEVFGTLIISCYLWNHAYHRHFFDLRNQDLFDITDLEDQLI